MKNNKVAFLALSIIAFSFVNTQADSYDREERRQRREDRRYRDGTLVGDTVRGAGRVADDTVDTGLNILTLGGHRRRQEERARENRNENERERDQE